MNSALGPLCAFLSSCTWALGIATYARVSRAHGPFSVNATRALVGLPFFVIWLVITSGGVGAAWSTLAAVPRANVGFLSLSILTSYALGDVVFLLAARRLGVPAALAIGSIYPLWAALGGVVFRGEPLGLVRLLGVLCVVVGLIVVIASSAATNGGPGPRGRTQLATGVLLGLLTSVLWAGNSVALGLGGQGVSTVVASVIRLGVALLVCPVLALMVRRPLPETAGPLLVPWPALRPVLWVFAVEAVGGTIFFTYGLANAPLAVGAALSSLAPVLSVPVAVLTGLERFSARKTIGIVAVVAGVALLFG